MSPQENRDNPFLLPSEQQGDDGVTVTRSLLAAMLENKLEIKEGKAAGRTEEQNSPKTPVIGIESKKSRNNQNTATTATATVTEGKNGEDHSAFFALATLNLPYINDKLMRMKEPSMHAQEVFDQLESAKESLNVEESKVTQISVDEDFGRKMTSTDIKERNSDLVSVNKKEFRSF